MPRIVHKYICNECEKEYDTMEKALECEKTHLKPKTVYRHPMNYSEVHFKEGDIHYGFPEHVVVEMDNGLYVEYRYRSMLPDTTKMKSEDIEQDTTKQSK